MNMTEALEMMATAQTAPAPAPTKRPVTREEVKAWTAKIDAMIREHYAGSGEWAARLNHGASVMFGKRYARIGSHEEANGIWCGWTSRYVHHFVDLTTGDILKGASWKAPAKHARGNILRPDAMDAVSVYGAAYLRR